VTSPQLAIRSLLKLTRLEIKIFAREPLGLFGSILIPIVLFVGLARFLGPTVPRPGRPLGTGAGFLPAVSLLSGIWQGDAWSAHAVDVVALVATFLICTAISAKVFRWE